MLNCTVHSDLDLKAVYWKVFNGYDTDNVRIKHLNWHTAGVTKENPALSLQSPKFYDSGEYFCYARNDAGPSLSPAISLKVNGGKFINCFETKTKSYNSILEKKTCLASNVASSLIEYFFPHKLGCYLYLS